MPKWTWKKRLNEVIKIMIRDVSFGNGAIGKRLSDALNELNNPKITAKVMKYFGRHMKYLGEIILSFDDCAMSEDCAKNLLRLHQEDMRKTVDAFRTMNVSLPNEPAKTKPFIGNALENVLTARYRHALCMLKEIALEKNEHYIV
jgi:hypothetical protein